jgi:hypothetical protein
MSRIPNGIHSMRNVTRANELKRMVYRQKNRAIASHLYVPLPVSAAPRRGCGLPELSQNVVSCLKSAQHRKRPHPVATRRNLPQACSRIPYPAKNFKCGVLFPLSNYLSI